VETTSDRLSPTSTSVDRIVATDFETILDSIKHEDPGVGVTTQSASLSTTWKKAFRLATVVRIHHVPSHSLLGLLDKYSVPWAY
jgi:hypothetical protein